MRSTCILLCVFHVAWPSTAALPPPPPPPPPSNDQADVGFTDHADLVEPGPLSMWATPGRWTRRLDPFGVARILSDFHPEPHHQRPVLSFTTPSQCQQRVQCSADGLMKVEVRVEALEQVNDSLPDSATINYSGESLAWAGATRAFGLNSTWQLRPDVVLVTVEHDNTVWDYDVYPTPIGRLRYNSGKAVPLPLSMQTGHATGHVPCVPNTIHRLTAIHRGVATSNHVIAVSSDSSDSSRSLSSSDSSEPSVSLLTTKASTRSSSRSTSASASTTDAFLSSLPGILKQARVRTEKNQAARSRLFEQEERVAFVYDPLHPSLRRLHPVVHLHPKLLTAVQQGRPEDAFALLTPVTGNSSGGVFGRPGMDGVVDSHPAAHTPFTRIFTLPVFSEEFCRLLLEELDAANNAAAIDWTRPNSMNEEGWILTELGMESFLQDLIDLYLRPVVSAVYPDWLGDSETELSAHAFIIRYRLGGDVNLERHSDDSDITLNICLGDGEFKGATVYFRGQRDHTLSRHEDLEVEHTPGVGLMHVGAHTHGTNRLEEGVRTNLVIWMRSKAFRRSPAEGLADECTVRE